MINPLSGILGSASGILLLVALFMWGQWQSAERELEAVKANNVILENSVATQQTTIDGMLDFSEKQADRLTEKDNELRLIRSHTEQQLLTINNLRLGAEVRAWEEPFVFGNDHSTRVTGHLMRLSSRYTSRDDTDPAETSDTR